MGTCGGAGRLGPLALGSLWACLAILSPLPGAASKAALSAAPWGAFWKASLTQPLRPQQGPRRRGPGG